MSMCVRAYFAAQNSQKVEHMPKGLFLCIDEGHLAKTVIFWRAVALISENLLVCHCSEL
jgi:hypothetical protein